MSLNETEGGVLLNPTTSPIPIPIPKSKMMETFQSSISLKRRKHSNGDGSEDSQVVEKRIEEACVDIPALDGAQFKIPSLALFSEIERGNLQAAVDVTACTQSSQSAHPDARIQRRYINVTPGSSVATPASSQPFPAPALLSLPALAVQRTPLPICRPVNLAVEKEMQLQKLLELIRDFDRTTPTPPTPLLPSALPQGQSPNRQNNRQDAWKALKTQIRPLPVIPPLIVKKSFNPKIDRVKKNPYLPTTFRLEGSLWLLSDQYHTPTRGLINADAPPDVVRNTLSLPDKISPNYQQTGPFRQAALWEFISRSYMKTELAKKVKTKHRSKRRFKHYAPGLNLPGRSWLDMADDEKSRYEIEFEKWVVANGYTMFSDDWSVEEMWKGYPSVL